jgi:hypothetical protein
MLKHFLQYFLFAFTMFAAADVSLGGGDAGGADGAADAGGHGEATGGEDAGLGDEGGDGSGSATEGADDSLGEEGDQLDADQERQDAQRQREPEDKDTADLKGLVSRRILALKKEAPGLTEIFKQHPKVQEQIEAAFRRDMGYRELGTIADFRSFREEFPGGMQDVQQLREELSEVEQLDQNFYGRDQQGNYNGHTNLISNLFNDDRDAAVALFRSVPKEWARLHPESYNEVMSSIVGATLQRSEIPEWLTECRDAAKAAKQDGLAASLDKLLRWSTGFLKQKQAPSEEERRIQTQREHLERDTNQRKQEDFTRFKQTFFSESDKLQLSIVRKHPAIAEMLGTKALSDQKKNEIVRGVQAKIREHLKTSRAFMSKLRPAYHSGNLDESLKLQKAQWSYPWILNKFVRAVLAEQAPTLVRQNRERARGATGSQRPPANRGNQNQNQSRERVRTEPYKQNGVWLSKEGRRLTTSEILRGAVPDHLLNAK